MTSNPSARLQRLVRLVDQALDQTLPAASASPRTIHAGMRYCVFSGGKRFRPLLCLAAAEAVGASPRAALPVACAIELIHTYSLVHDDLPAMDDDDLRRGQPTCHRKFGEGPAILVGDALLTYAFELLSGIPSKRSASRDGHPNTVAIIREISRACGTTGLIGGQALDLQTNGSAKPQALRTIARQKTGALITASVVAGALAGRALPKQLQALRKYGQNMGLAFQLIDDVHDRDALARVLGRHAACREAGRLIQQAGRQLHTFGSRADGLREIAHWLSSTA